MEKGLENSGNGGKKSHREWVKGAQDPRRYRGLGREKIGGLDKSWVEKSLKKHKNPNPKTNKSPKPIVGAKFIQKKHGREIYFQKKISWVGNS